MGGVNNDRLVAMLGPTNTGKTHYAIERMCGHSSGLMGFPLRLLAREVYDRVVAIKGKDAVALLTGEEKILPSAARYFLCTAESMPTRDSLRIGGGNAGLRDFAFVALDEAQLAADQERGHVFTDRLLHARGREETLILGSETLRPMLRALTPNAEIIGRPRFSTLTYAGPRKLSRLPKRSVVVAFSAEEVYAVAEMLRRLRGGAAVVMGALSPRTRNAQVQMYQAGEVDYLVATDAVGMGLNMDVTHVAFASLRKFDGKRSRRLSIPEMAQIAGRAGRHQRDGTFGTLGADGSSASFDPEEAMAIEGHHFKPLDHLYWRDGSPDYASVERLIGSLEAKPDHPVLRAAPEAIDLAVLKRLAAEPEVARRGRGHVMTERLWAACGLPDFRKTGVEHHSRLVGRIFQHLSEGDRHIPAQWFADEIARLDTVQGDVETIADRIAAARTWAYIAHRADWLAEPAHWAERTRNLEEKLSDALHERLTQRFVDRRTSVLLRDLDKRGAELLPVAIAEDGQVSVSDEPIGHLSGFRFVADAAARHADMKRLMAAAERRLGVELGRRAKALVTDPDDGFTLATDIGRPVAIFWRGDVVARLGKGRALTEPRLTLHRSLDTLTVSDRDLVTERLEQWLRTAIARQLAPLAALSAAARDKTTPALLRGLFAPVAEAGGIVARDCLSAALAELSREQRRAAAHLGLKIGTLDVFVPALLKPEPMRWRLALIAVRADATMPPVPVPGSVMLDRPNAPLRAAAVRAGFRDLGEQMLRVDLIERLARHAHDARNGHRRFVPDPSLSTSLGLKPPAVARLMRTLGFARRDDQGAVTWQWRGRREDRAEEPKPKLVNAFGVLLQLLPPHAPPPQKQGAHG